MRLEDVTSQQSEVVDFVHDATASLLVLGGPGTGKTTAALCAARSFLDENSQARVLFLTFSRSAVSQIVARARGLLTGVEQRVEILTFHGLAYRLIRAFGRYGGQGTDSVSIQTVTRQKLLGRDPGQFVFDELVPTASSLVLDSSRISSLLAARWPLVICDEVQDTNEEQWTLLQALRPRKLLMLGDSNQMIYTFIPGVTPERFEAIRKLANREIELEPHSHRDPSGLIPAVAAAVMYRRFDDDAIDEALRCGRLVVHTNIGTDECESLLASEIAAARKDGSRSVGIFGHSNVGVAELAESLTRSGIEHVLIGIPEAHAEALRTMVTLAAFAVDEATDEDVRTSLALYLTACVRGNNPPAMAFALLGRAALPTAVERAVHELEQVLRESADDDMARVADIVTRAWLDLPFTAGRRPWRRAAAHFIRLIRPELSQTASPVAVARIAEVVEPAITDSLIDLDYSKRGSVSLMNFHQTKGREADTVIHVYHDYFDRDLPPYPKASRLLNVAISRARKKVVLILPPDPHPVIEPLTRLGRGS